MMLASGCATLSTTKDSKYGTSNQGIPITQLELNKIKIGMHKKQVANIIGHPPHINPFAPDVWVYFHMTHGAITKEQALKLTFKDNKLIKIEHINTKTKQTTKA